MDSNGAAVFLEGHTEFFEGEFGMVSCPRWLGDTGDAVCEQSGEKDG